MSFKRPTFLLALLALCLFLGTHAASAQAQENELREAIQHEQQRADQRQESIEQLERQKRATDKQLAQVEKEVERIKGEIRLREQELAAIEASEAEARQNYLTLRTERDGLTEKLKTLLQSLWPIHAGRIAAGLGELDSWQETDRRFTWLAALYSATADLFDKIALATEQMRLNLEEQSRLALEAEAKLAEVNEAKDKLLGKRLSLLAAQRKAEARKADLESDLHSSLEVIKDLNYKLRSQRTKRFADNKKLLPWPVDGPVISSFAPSATPARRGIGLACSPSATVKSVFWGKVVHSDILRGFGHVVIVYHGNDYYSVYAYLAGAMVEPGQEVEKDEPIGTAGLHPQTREPGLYFELRFGSKPINPLHWLFPK